MAYTPSYQVNVEKQNVVVRFRRDMIDQIALGKFLDYLELESIRKRSQLTEEQAAALAGEIDRSVWESIESAFTET
ncbi:MAG: hypothetical protein HY872_01295 [Chloroflexi bacterium]|nr:hypothetical protein [Chloroflexota bacterium]